MATVNILMLNHFIYNCNTTYLPYINNSVEFVDNVYVLKQ